MVQKKNNSQTAKITIKKSTKGTFTKVAKGSGMTVQQKAKAVLKKGSKATPAMKKKA